MPLLETFNDNFNDNAIDPVKWNYAYNYAYEANQQLEMYTVAGGAYSGLTSFDGWDLTGSYVQNQVVNAGNQSYSSLEVYPVQIYSSGNVNGYLIMINTNIIRTYRRTSSVNSVIGSTLAYNSAIHKYFRIREAGSVVYYEWSTTGLPGSWTVINSVAKTFAITSMIVEISCGTYATETAGSTIIFDNFNVIPAASTSMSFLEMF